MRILDSPKTLIRLSGIPQHEVKIIFTGLRPGEKIFDDLFYGFEKRDEYTAKRCSEPKAKSHRGRRCSTNWLSCGRRARPAYLVAFAPK